MSPDCLAEQAVHEAWWTLSPLQKYRAVLMDQDVLHRLSAPSRLAQGQPRYSLVWKLVFLPLGGAQPSIARPEWGSPTAFGSAAKMQAAAKQMASQAKRTRCEPS